MRWYKTILALLLCGCLLAAPMSPVAAQGGYPNGDVNNDGSINAADALLVLQQSVRLVTLSANAFTAADTNADGTVDAADALLILQYSVELIFMFPADMSGEERYYAARDAYYGATGKDFVNNGETDLEDVKSLLEKYGQDPEAADVDNCAISEDGLLLYNPISNAAARQKKLNRYDKADKVSGTIEFNGAVLHYSMPSKVTAYDAVHYLYPDQRLSGAAGTHQRHHV